MVSLSIGVGPGEYLGMTEFYARISPIARKLIGQLLPPTQFMKTLLE